MGISRSQCFGGRGTCEELGVSFRLSRVFAAINKESSFLRFMSPYKHIDVGSRRLSLGDCRGINNIRRSSQEARNDPTLSGRTQKRPISPKSHREESRQRTRCHRSFKYNVTNHRKLSSLGCPSGMIVECLLDIVNNAWLASASAGCESCPCVAKDQAHALLVGQVEWLLDLGKDQGREEKKGREDREIDR